jgi:hypothetical protein
MLYAVRVSQTRRSLLRATAQASGFRSLWIFTMRATVHVLGRRKDRLEMARKTISGDGPRFLCHQCDVLDYENIKDVFRRIKEGSGYLYGPVNDAAVNPSRNDILHTDLKDWIEKFFLERTTVFLENGRRVLAWIYIYNRATEGLRLVQSGDYFER